MKCPNICIFSFYRGGSHFLAMVNISLKIRLSILLLHEKEKLNIVANILISETKRQYSILREADESFPGA